MSPLEVRALRSLATRGELTALERVELAALAARAARELEELEEQNPIAWLRHRGYELASLTGQDARALRAVADCWDLYAASDTTGRVVVIRAVRELLRAMQAKQLPKARDLIARSLDWPDRDQLWPTVDPEARAPRMALTVAGKSPRRPKVAR